MDEPPSKTDRVKAWFKAHVDSEAGQAFVTDDMNFVMPPSAASSLTGDLPWNGRESLRRLGILDRALYKTYGVESKMKLHFIIEEGDWVLMQFESTFDTWEDELYHNYYVFGVRFKDDKIAEAFDLNDTAHLETLILGTPEKSAGFKARIAAMRSEMNAPKDVW